MDWDNFVQLTKDEQLEALNNFKVQPQVYNPHWLQLIGIEYVNCRYVYKCIVNSVPSDSWFNSWNCDINHSLT